MRITSLNLADIHRAETTHRWHILHNKRRQSVAEHGYSVAMISLEILEGLGYHCGEYHMESLKWALVHDLPEVVIGDIVSPVKQKCGGLIDQIEDQIDPNRAAYRDKLPKIVICVVKAADFIDSLKFLHYEGLNGQARVVYDKTYSKFKKFLESCADLVPAHNWNCCDRILLRAVAGKQTFIDDFDL